MTHVYGSFNWLRAHCPTLNCSIHDRVDRHSRRNEEKIRTSSSFSRIFHRIFLYKIIKKNNQISLEKFKSKIPFIGEK